MSKLKTNRMEEKVNVTCYNKTKTMTRRDAMKLYYDGMCNSEGSEHERYETIFFQLMAGFTECSDEVSFFGM